jgi:hypothetical protein
MAQWQTFVVMVMKLGLDGGTTVYWNLNKCTLQWIQGLFPGDEVAEVWR